MLLSNSWCSSGMNIWYQKMIWSNVGNSVWIGWNGYYLYCHLQSFQCHTSSMSADWWFHLFSASLCLFLCLFAASSSFSSSFLNVSLSSIPCLSFWNESFFLRTDYSGRATVAMEIEQSHACKAILLMDRGELWLYSGNRSLLLWGFERNDNLWHP